MHQISQVIKGLVMIYPPIPLVLPLASQIINTKTVADIMDIARGTMYSQMISKKLTGSTYNII